MARARSGQPVLVVPHAGLSGGGYRRNSWRRTVFDAARTGADGICIVRGLGDQPGSAVSALLAAMHAGRASPESSGAKHVWPDPSLSPTSV